MLHKHHSLVDILLGIVSVQFPILFRLSLTYTEYYSFLHLSCLPLDI